MSAIPPTSFPSQIFGFEVFNCFSKPSTKLEAILSQSQDMSSESFTGSLNQAEVLLHVRSNEQLQTCSHFFIRNMLILQ